MPMISAACHQLIFFPIARKITSCTFIARSTAALGYVPTLSRMDTSSPPAKRTFHVLTSPDISCANDKGRPDTGLSAFLMPCCQHLVHVFRDRHVALFLVLHLEI